MAMKPGYLIDTNILLRLSIPVDPQHSLIRSSLNQLDRQSFELYYSLQNVAEFWNVSTRPSDRNGFGLSVTETSRKLSAIERTMTLLPDIAGVYTLWRELLERHEVRGVQVHDARLAALMQAHGVTYILTLNQPDFLRYPAIRAVHPHEVVQAG
jgi:predicted nucleic acid-binding protein